MGNTTLIHYLRENVRNRCEIIFSNAGVGVEVNIEKNETPNMTPDKKSHMYTQTMQI